MQVGLLSSSFHLYMYTEITAQTPIKTLRNGTWRNRAGKKMPSVLRKESFRWLMPRLCERRLVCKNGDCNISRVNIDKRGRRFLADIFTTMVDIKWRWNLLIFTMAFTVSWIIFAMAWWLIAFSHRDLENYGHPGWKPCVEHVRRQSRIFVTLINNSF